MKKRRSRLIDETEFRENFGFRQNARSTPKTIIKTISIDENPKDSRNGFRSDSASWTSRDELGSAGDLIEVPACVDERVETYSSSGVGSESSEPCPQGLSSRLSPVPSESGESELPLEIQLRINRRASKYKPIRIRAPAASHVSNDQAGNLQYRLGRRKWQEVWCVVVENLLYIYESIGAQITWDVIDLSCFKPITDLQQNKSRFKLKIVNNNHESHEFHTENAAQFYLWFATFDRIHNRGVQKSLTRERENTGQPIDRYLRPVSEIDFLRAPDINMGLTPTSNKKKQEINEKYRKMRVDCATEVQSKITRLTQRRLSTSQKISKMNTYSGSKVILARKGGLQNELEEINEEIKQTEILSKEAMSKIAAERERELGRLDRSRRIPEKGQLEFYEESEEEEFSDLLGLSPTSDAISTSSDIKPFKKSRVRLSGSQPFKKIQNFARSLTRSKSTNDGQKSKRSLRSQPKKELSASSLFSGSIDRPKSMIDFLEKSECSDEKSEIRGKLAVCQSSFEDEDISGKITDSGAVSSTSIASFSGIDQVKAEENRLKNLKKLDESTLDEILKFDSFAEEFDSLATDVTDDHGLSNLPQAPYRENLI